MINIVIVGASIGLGTIGALVYFNPKLPDLIRGYLRYNKQDEKDISDTKEYIGEETDPPLVKHMNTFAGENGLISTNSIFSILKRKWKLTDEQANGVAIRTMLMAYYSGVPGVRLTKDGIQGGFYAKDAINLMTHPGDTGFYNQTGGDVNTERLAALEELAQIKEDGENYISRDTIEKYLSTFRATDTRWDNHPCLFKILGKLGNKGEYNLVFENLCTKKDYVSLPLFKQFLYDSRLVVNALASEKLNEILPTCSQNFPSKATI